MLITAASIPATAQTSTPSLDDVLTRVRANFNAYLKDVPNILGDEHIDSKMYIPGTMSLSGASFSMNLSMPTDDAPPSSPSMNLTMDVSEHQVIDTSFQMQHDGTQKSAYNLVETHSVTSLNGKPAPPNYKFSAPFVMSGAFSYSTGIIAPQMKPCYDFKLETGKKLHGVPVLIVDYTQKLAKPDFTPCIPAEPITGRAYIDPKTMQVLRFEQTRKHHALILSNAYETRYIWSWWSWSVDYAPVQLHDETFYLPKTISSKAISTDGTLMSWSYTNTYSDYHLLAATTTLLPGYKVEPTH
jgi:hypothetical protein